MSTWLNAYLLIAISFNVLGPPATAQVAPDHTLSTVTTVQTENNQDFQITGGARVGSNLYHSFDSFSVPMNGSAQFLNPTDITNIFSRVTGQNPSQIDGLIQNQGNASLFLLNPHGILFGANASLNIGGSFVATTAESLVFQDGKIFSSVIGQSSPLLSINLPMGLQFGQQAQSIQVQTLADRLVVKPLQTLALLGGDIETIGSPLPNIDSAHLKAPAGRIDIGSVAAGSFVNLVPDPLGWQFSYDKVQQFQDITLSDLTTVDVSESERVIADLSQLELGSGSIQMVGRNITLSEGSALISFVFGEKSAGNIVVQASDTLKLIGFRDDLSSGLFTRTFNNGNAGNIEVITKHFSIQDGAGIFSDTFSSMNGSDIEGNSGNLRILASESIEMSGSNSEVGNSSIAVATRTAGDAGMIDITTKRLVMRDGAEIRASTFPLVGVPLPSKDFGDGGLININATEIVNLEGTGLFREFDDIAEINRITTIPSRIVATTQGSGDGGNIDLKTGQLILQNQAMTDFRGTITTSGTSLGNAGNIAIEAESIVINNQALISAESNSGEGGNIQINASDFIVLRNNIEGTPLNNPYISAQAVGGNGGNILIQTPFIEAVALENTDIVANAEAGNGGSIELRTFAIFGLEEREFSEFSDINASSQFGVSGIINISRLDLDPQSSFATLPADVIDPQNIIVQQCGTVGEYAGGRFVIVGRSGLSLNPLTSIDSIQGLVDLRTPTLTQEDSRFNPSFSPLPLPKPIIEAQAWSLKEDGTVVLKAEGNAPKTLDFPACPSL